MVFHEGFLGHKLSVLMKFQLVLSHLWPKSFASQKYRSYVIKCGVATVAKWFFFVSNASILLYWKSFQPSLMLVPLKGIYQTRLKPPARYKPGNPHWRGRFSTVYLLAKIMCLLKIYYFDIKSICYELVTARRSTVLSLLFQKGFPGQPVTKFYGIWDQGDEVVLGPVGWVRRDVAVRSRRTEERFRRNFERQEGPQEEHGNHLGTVL